MSYIEDNLMPNEKSVHTVKVRMKAASHFSGS